MMRKHLKIFHRLPKFSFITLLTLLLLSQTSNVQAKEKDRDIRYGFGIGYGGAGVKDTVDVNGTLISAEKSEGPGVGSLFVENLFDDNFSMGLEHSFGFRMGPFSAGVSFSGLTSRWYFYGPALFRVDASDERTTFFTKRYALYYGLGAGIANAYLNRTNDAVSNISASGVYFGPKLGADYSYSKQVGFRYEFSYLSTFISTAATSPKLTELALLFGVFYYY